MPKVTDIASLLAPRTSTKSDSQLIFVGPKTASAEQPLSIQIFGDHNEFKQVFDGGLRKSRRPVGDERGTTKFLVNAYLPATKTVVALSYGRMLLEKLYEVAGLFDKQPSEMVFEVVVTGSAKDTAYSVKPSKKFKALTADEIGKLKQINLDEVEANLFAATDKAQAEADAQLKMLEDAINAKGPYAGKGDELENAA